MSATWRLDMENSDASFATVKGVVLFHVMVTDEATDFFFAGTFTEKQA